MLNDSSGGFQSFSAPSIYVTWSADTAFEIGSICQYGNGLYRAKWWTRGDTPTKTGDGAWEYIGEILSDEEVNVIETGELVESILVLHEDMEQNNLLLQSINEKVGFIYAIILIVVVVQFLWTMFNKWFFGA